MEYNIRLSIPYFRFNPQPNTFILSKHIEKERERILKEFLGKDAIIEKYEILPLITNSSCVIVDVVYKISKFNPYEVYFIKLENVKQLINSTNKVVIINNSPVMLLENKELQACRIYPITSPTNGINYVAIKVYTPLSKYNSSNKLIEYSAFNTIDVKPLYTKEPKISKLSDTEVIKSYKNTISEYFESQQVIDVKVIKSFSQITQIDVVGYIVPFSILMEQIKKDKLLTGIIILSDIRNVDEVMFIMNYSYNISIDMMNSISKLIECDKINLCNWITSGLTWPVTI